MIPVKLDQLFLSNMGFVVLLKGSGDNRTLPIFIGAAEAQSIAIHINKVKIPRPLTHDLLKNMLDFLECRLMRVEVCDFKEGTFFARLVLERDGRELHMDSRPSDAMALAIRVGAPIYVDERVMEEAGQVLNPAAEADAKAGKQTDKKDLTPLEMLKRDLDSAVQEEKYEDAAKLRDEIKRLEHTHTKN